MCSASLWCVSCQVLVLMKSLYVLSFPLSPPPSWEQEKTRRAQKWQEEQRKESYSKDECEKDSDTGDDLSDIPEPQEVTLAREHIATLLGEQDKLHKQKVFKSREWRASQLRWGGEVAL